MPYVKKQTDPLRRLICAYELGTCRKLGEVLGVSASTAGARLHDPGSLSAAELRRLSTHGHIPIEEVRAAI